MADVLDYAEKQLSKKAYEKLLFDTRMYGNNPQNKKVVDLIKQGKSVDEAFKLVYPQRQLSPEEEKALFDVDETVEPLGENPFDFLFDVEETGNALINDDNLLGPPRQQESAQSAKLAPQKPEPTGAFQEYKKSLELPPRRLFPMLRRRRFFRQ